jgi:hypothetical protein
MNVSFIRIVISAVVAASRLVSGCVYRTSNGTYDGVSAAYPSESEKMAHMAAIEMSRRYPPGHTTLVLSAVPGKFGAAFEEELRVQGFAVRQPGNKLGSSTDVGVSYTLDTIGDEPSCYLRVLLSDGGTYGFAGVLHPESASPSVPTLPTPAVASVEQSEVRPLPDSRALATGFSPAAGPLGGGLPLPAYRLAGSWPAGHIPPFRVHTRGTAARIAERNRVAVDDFCIWNGVTADTILEQGERVYLREPKYLRETKTASSSGAMVPGIASASPIRLPDAVPVLSSPSIQPLAQRPAPAPALAPAPRSFAAPVFGTSDKAVEQLQPAIMPVEEKWDISPGSLRFQIAEWCSTAGYTLVWQADNDYEMGSFAAFRGDFVEGVKQLFSSLQRAGFPLRITIYKRNQVLEVVEN